jgi:Uncharacterized protein conserved in bacteria (DUF2076)
MTPQEQQLITELFARLKQTPAQAKDAVADQLIRRGVTDNPEAPYRLVQTVLIQEMALSQAQHRIAGLENRVVQAKRSVERTTAAAGDELLGRSRYAACGALGACAAAHGAGVPADCACCCAGDDVRRAIGIFAVRRRHCARRRRRANAFPGHRIDVRSTRGKHPVGSIDSAGAQ